MNSENAYKRFRDERGAIMLVTYFLLAALAAMLAIYYSFADIELATTKYSKESVTGFYSAEAGLNDRAEEIRSIFVGYNRPEGTPPTSGSECEGGNNGSDDYACETLSINNRSVITYMTEDPSNPSIISIPAGERYQGLNAQEYRYTATSRSVNIEGNTEAVLELRFKSRLVPLFQFVAFYNKDLEIAPGPAMTLSGPIHTNGDLYLNAGNSLAIDGQVTTAGDLYRGRKNNNVCDNNDVTVPAPSVPAPIYPACGGRTQVTEAYLDPWDDMVQVEVDVLTVPEPEALDAAPGAAYWDAADLRLGLQLDAANNPVTSAASPTGVYVYNSDTSVDTAATSSLHGCGGGIGGRPVGATNTFFNNREGRTIRMLEVSMQDLFNCLDSTNWLTTAARTLDDSTEGGLVFHFSFDGPDTDALPNSYGVRMRSTTELQSSNAGADEVRGLTVATDQAVYTHSHYNSTNKIPAAILADAFNVLSSNWNLNDNASTQALNNRQATNTTINAAVLAGTDTTGGVEGSGGQGGGYNGGLENYPRLHENWSGDTLTYRGSFVSLNTPRHSNGAWVYGGAQYTAPGRNWDYDTDFNDADNLPPLTPRFVYVKQELFVRDFGE